MNENDFTFKTHKPKWEMKSQENSQRGQTIISNSNRTFI